MKGWLSMFCGCFGSCSDEDNRDEPDGPIGGKPIQHDPDFRGPIRGKARRPKDLLCLFIFLIFISVFFAIGIFSWASGEPARIVYPTDSEGRLCGVHDGVKDKPNLLFFDLTRCAQIVTVSELLSGNVDASSLFTCPTPQVCVESCPSENSFGVRDNPVCVDGVVTTRYTNLTGGSLDPFSAVESASAISELLDHIANERCAPYYLRSESVANRCVPTIIDLNELLMNAEENITLNSTVSNANSNDSFSITISLDALINGSVAQALIVNTRQFLLDVYQDITVVWPALLIGLALCIIFSFTYILFLGCCACGVVSLGIIFCFLVVLTIAGFAYFQYYCFQSNADLFNSFDPNSETITAFLNETQDVATQLCLDTSIVRNFISAQLPWFQYQEETWLAIGIIATVFFLILLLILLVLLKSLRISVQIIKEASRAVVGVPMSLVYPIFTWLMVVILFFYWGVVAVFLLTASEATYSVSMNATADVNELLRLGLVDESNPNNAVVNGSRCFPKDMTSPWFGANQTRFVAHALAPMENVVVSCNFDQFVTSNFLLGIQIYHLFGLFWIGNFILAVGECTLAGAFASWYWAFRKPKDVPTFAVISAFGRTILFHSGSLAFGALIIAIIQLIRAILAYVQKKLKGKTGRLTQALLCCLQCCFWFLEKIIRYVNRQAYIEIAIYGYDFCTGACKAVKLLLRNILTTAVKDRIVAFLLFMGKIAIMGGIGILAYLGFGPYEEQGRILWGQPLNYYLVPVILLVAVAYFVSSGFMSVYHMAVDTIFICALEDVERNNGDDKPYFMSESLQGIMGVKNKVNHPDGTDGTDGNEPMQLESMENVND